MARELAIAGVALAAGLLAMPLLVWIAGRAVVGPYANGGAGAFMSDYFRGLASGSSACWVLLAGPYAVAWCVRLGWRLVRQR